MATGLYRHTGNIHKGLYGATVPSFPSVLDDGNTVAWYDYLKLVTKDGSDFVSVWGDQSGLSHDLLQAVGTNQPKWFSINGILFDGIDNFLKTAAFALIQPEMIYIVFKQLTWTNDDRIFDGNAVNSGLMRQTGASPGLGLFAGSVGPSNVNLILDTYGIARVLFNGVSSKFIINETTPIIGDAGSSDMGGFTLGARGDGTATYGNIQVKEVIIRKVADAAQDEADIYSYLSTKYGI